MDKKGLGLPPQAATNDQDRVWFTAGLTINMGDYNSARVDAGMATTVRKGETPEQAYERIREFVVVEVETQINDIRGMTSDTPPTQRTKKRGAKGARKS